MKKRVIYLLLLVVLVCIPFMACESSTNTQTYTKGLVFNRLSDGTYEVCSYSGKDTHVIIPKKYKGNLVTRIGAEAFGYCSNVISITIPDSVTSKGDRAFCVCISLTNITIPDSVTSIEGRAFSFCYSLTSITIPDSVISIDDYAFESSKKLTIYCEADSKPSGWIDKWNYLNRPVIWNYKNNNTSEAEYKYVTKNGINYAVDESSAKVVGTDVSGDVVLPSQITYNSKTYPVTTIEENAFYYCRDMLSITIPSSITTIEENSFDVCIDLTIYCEADSKPNGWSDNWNILNRPVVWDYKNNKIADDGYEYKIKKNGINYAVNNSTAKVVLGKVSGKVVIPSSITHNSKTYPVTQIGDSAFRNCDLISIEIPKTLTSIGSMVFYNCYKLTNITIPDSVMSIDDSAFEWCDKLVIYCEADSKPNGWSRDWNSLNRPVIWDCKNNNTLNDSDSNTVEYGITINGINYAIYNDYCAEVVGTSVSGKVVIPSSINHNSKTYPVECIGYKAFYNCFDLTSITIPESVTSIEREAFYNCFSLANVTIPKSVTNIGKYAFFNCYSLTSITISDSATSIGESAFSSCTSLSSITISDSVTNIESRAFSNCDSLTSIIIPDSVTSVGEMLFYNCYNLTIYCEAESEPKDWDPYWNYESWNYSPHPVEWGYKDELMSS